MKLPSIFYKKRCWIFSAIAIVVIIVTVLLAVFLTQEQEPAPAPEPGTTQIPTTVGTASVPTLPPPDGKFPATFLFGVSSAAYQVEGGHNADGKGPSIWDDFTQKYPDKIKDHTNGNVAANSYEMYKEDVKYLKEIGVNFYRFSISWSRVMANGDIASINEEGLKYYDKLIDELIANGIEPMVTMYHFDLPQALQNFGGWTNQLIVDYFEEYANLLFSRYGDRVKYWLTLNEPVLYCTFGYGSTIFPPIANMHGVGEYLCGHYSLLAHARAYALYRDKYFSKFHGQVGIGLDIDYSWPKNQNIAEDREAAERYLEMKLGWMANPIYKTDYPSLMKNIILKNSQDEGRPRSRLPTFTLNEILLLRGSSDFIGLNYYSSSYSEPAGNLDEFPNPSFERDMNVKLSYDPKWPRAKSTWLYSVPEGLADTLIWIKDKYSNPKVIITENGWSDDGQVNDVARSKYIKDHLRVVLNAIQLSGCNVVGYTYCGLLDNFEWIQGFTEKFGLINVDFNSPNRERVMKNSAITLSEIIQTRMVPEPYPSPDDIISRFPRNFKFGTATAAYQIEGAWNRDGKGANIWDTQTHYFPETIRDRSNGDIAANSYQLYPDDIKAMKEMGIQFYRFSISWSRVLSNGDVSSKNELGLQYYDNLINELWKNGIEPMPTMYHWDLPQALQEFGGWTNPLIVDYFEQYAKVLYERYGDRVKHWFTLNEPYSFCVQGYGLGKEAPLVYSPGIGIYLCAHHVTLAHARAYRLYKREFYHFKGKVGPVLNFYYYWPKDPAKQEDVDSAERAITFFNGWYGNPIFGKDGDYPKMMREIIDKNSKDEGLTFSRLPKFTEEEIAMVKGTADFLGLNYYTGYYTTPSQHPEEHDIPSFEHDRFMDIHVDDKWPQSASDWLYDVPAAFEALLKWVKEEYDNPEVIITENGWSDRGGLEDYDRIRYLSGHLHVLLNAIWDNGCDVTGYAYWSFIDNFEWLRGYTEKFGLYQVDFNDYSRPRTPKLSSKFYTSVIKTRDIPNTETISNTSYTFS